MIFPLLPNFLTRTFQAGPAAIGLIEGVAEATASFMKMVSGWLSDRSPPAQADRRGRLLDRRVRASPGGPRDELGPGARDPLRRPDRQGNPHLAARRAARRHGAAGAAGGARSACSAPWTTPAPSRAAAGGLPAEVRLRGRALGLPAGGRARARGGRRSCSSRSRRLPRARQASDAGPRADAAARSPRRFWIAIGIFVLFTLASSTDAFLLLRAGSLGMPALAAAAALGRLPRGQGRRGRAGRRAGGPARAHPARSSPDGASTRSPTSASPTSPIPRSSGASSPSTRSSTR